jgi:UDP-N-acetylglucosamine 1-carboxyvinyltransferase
MTKTGQKFIINGLSGKRTLAGKIRTPGAKNAVLKVMAAAVLFKDEVYLTNVPEIEDVARMSELLVDLGVVVEKISRSAYRLLTNNIVGSDICPEISKHLRASLVLTGPLLARFGHVSFPHPGGCVIGKRPIDFSIAGFEAMGAKCLDTGTGYEIIAPKGGLRGAEIFFKNQSVTTTENFLMAAVGARGVTVLKNAALEPEIISLGEFLNTCGAKISGLGTPTITIQGTGLLSGKGRKYVTIPDRIVAGSFAILGALAGRDLEITDCQPGHLDALLHILKLAGVKMEVTESTIRLRGKQGKFMAVDIKTHEYPGLVTDLQAPLAVFLTQSQGQSFIFETIFEGRLNYLETLSRMGAETKILDAHRALIKGSCPLLGREVVSPDLRAGLAYVLAGIIASGETVVHNVYYIDRGYEKIERLLRAVGVDIKRV